MSESAPVNILCLKWGKRYPASYTNILYHSVRRHLHRPFRFVCATDDPTGLDEGIDAVPLPPNPGYPEKQWPGIFAKLAIYQDGYAQLQGSTLFLDVDVVIMNDIDCFFDYLPGKNCMIHNWIEWHKTIFRKRRIDIGSETVDERVKSLADLPEKFRNILTPFLIHILTRARRRGVAVFAALARKTCLNCSLRR